MSREDCRELEYSETCCCIEDQDTPATNTDKSHGSDKGNDDSKNSTLHSVQKSSKAHDTAQTKRNKNNDRENTSPESKPKLTKAYDRAPTIGNKNDDRENTHPKSEHTLRKAHDEAPTTWCSPCAGCEDTSLDLKPKSQDIAPTTWFSPCAGSEDTSLDLKPKSQDIAPTTWCSPCADCEDTSLDIKPKSHDIAPTTWCSPCAGCEDTSLDLKPKPHDIAPTTYKIDDQQTLSTNKPTPNKAIDKRSKDSNKRRQQPKLASKHSLNATDKSRPHVEIDQKPPDTMPVPRYSSSDRPRSTTDNAYDKTGSSSITSGQSTPYGLTSDSSNLKSTQREPIDQLYIDSGLNNDDGNRNRNSLIRGLDSFSFEDFNCRNILILLCSVLGSGVLLCILKKFLNLVCAFCNDCDCQLYTEDFDDYADC